MKKLKIVNDRKLLFKQKVITFVLLALFLVLFTMMGIRTLNNSKLIDHEGEIASIVESQDYEGYMVVNLEPAEGISFLVPNEASDGLAVGDPIHFKTTKATRNYALVYTISTADNVKYDTSAKLVKNAWFLFSLALVFDVVIIGILIFTIVKILKTPAEEEHDYVEYMLNHYNVLTSQMLPKESASAKIIKRYAIISRIFLIFGVLAVVGLLILLQYRQPWTNFVVGGVALLFIASLVLVIVLKPKFYSKKAPIFANDYIAYLKSGVELSFYKNQCNFLREGMKLTREGKEDSYFDYHELNLYAVGLFSRTIDCANIFICSEFPDDEEHQDIKDFIIPLTAESYQEIIDNNIEIRGLQYLVEHFEEEIINQSKEVKSRVKVVKYLD